MNTLEELEKEFEYLAVRTKDFVNNADDVIRSMIVYQRSLSILWAYEKINEQKKEIGLLNYKLDELNKSMLPTAEQDYYITKDINI